MKVPNRFGQPGTAIHFTGRANGTGLDEGVVVPHDTRLSNNSMTELTLVAWVRTSNVAGFDNGIQRLVSKGRSFEYNYSLYLQNGRAAVTAWQFAGADHLIVRQGTSLVADSRWYLLVGVIRNGAFAQLYVDGVLEGEDLTPTGTWNRTGLGDFTIGRYPDIDDWNEPYDGDIDDVRVYRRAFTAQEVASLYASEHP